MARKKEEKDGGEPLPPCGLCGEEKGHPRDGAELYWLVCQRCDLIPVVSRKAS